MKRGRVLRQRDVGADSECESECDYADRQNSHCDEFSRRDAIHPECDESMGIRCWGLEQKQPFVKGEEWRLQHKLQARKG